MHSGFSSFMQTGVHAFIGFTQSMAIIGRYRLNWSKHPLLFYYFPVAKLLMFDLEVGTLGG